MHTYSCVRARAHIYTHARTHARTPARKHTQDHTFTLSCICTHEHRHMYVHLHTYINIHTLSHAHTVLGVLFLNHFSLLRIHTILIAAPTLTDLSNLNQWLSLVPHFDAMLAVFNESITHNCCVGLWITALVGLYWLNRSQR